MKPLCVKCHSLMKVVYVRVDKNWETVENYYYCNNCKKIKKIDKDIIYLTNTIIRYAKYNFQPGYVDFKLNLKRHQHKFDFWIKDEAEFIIKFCNNYVIQQDIPKDVKEDFIKIVVNGNWTRKFNSGNISITATLDEESN